MGMGEGDRIGQDQFFDLITREELGWQAIIYDLIKTEQLDPWDIDIGVLADKYVEIIQQLEEADFFVSSKVLLACSLLLRLKSEILINSYIEDLNQALFGRKEDKKYEMERIEIDEAEIPLLVPKTPMSRHKKVTLQELMGALNKAIDTENRRIKREIKGRRAEKAILTVMPKSTHVPLKVRIKSIFGVLTDHMKGNNSMHFTNLAPSKEEQLASFVPVLHLANNGRVHLWQPEHFRDIHISFGMHDDEKKILADEVGLADSEEDYIDMTE
jgi:segregation and condensation protein A